MFSLLDEDEFAEASPDLEALCRAPFAKMVEMVLSVS